MKYFYGIEDLESLENKEKESNFNLDYSNPDMIRKRRFFVSRGGSGKVVFLDDIWFVIWEHRFDKDGDRYNYETCIKDIEGTCPLCDKNNRRYLAVVTTVLSKWTDESGNTKYSKKLLVAKGDAKDRLVRRQKKFKEEDGSGLKGKVFSFYRDKGKTSNAVGTDIEYEKTINLEDLKPYCPDSLDFEEWISPFDYPEIFKPKSLKELEEIVGLSVNISDNLGDEVKDVL